MLYLNRKPGDAVIINHNIEVRVIEVRGKTVKLGFDFPQEASVLRAEVVEQVMEANRRAIDAVRGIGEAKEDVKAPVADGDGEIVT